MIEALNSLLRDELAAVAGYQKALGAMRKKAIADGDHILRLASDHQRTVAALHGSVQARGGDRSLVIGGEPEFVGALLEAEQRGLAEYEAALVSLDDDARELVELELIPRQRRHVDALSALLVNLAA